MSVNSYDELRYHVGHKIVCVGYAPHADAKGEQHWQNVAIECEDCGSVLLDYDQPEPLPEKCIGCGDRAPEAGSNLCFICREF